jgi:tripartite-type tricarboxylate transporter receptor subunit TctC
MSISRRAVLAAAALPCAASAQGQAPWQPDRPLTMIVAYAAGGGTDTAARLLARMLERQLGQPVVVTNRAGASGAIGFTELARARPDGYTIGFTNTPTIVTIPIEHRDARFKLDDFAFIANIVDDPGGLWVLAASPIRSLADLLAEARRRPGEVSYGTSGIGSDDHLAMLAIERATGTRFLHVPYAGSAPVRTALMGRTIDLAVVNMGEGVPDWRQGLTRPLGQLAPSRWAMAAEVPTLREQGLDVVEGSMRGLAAPAGLPPAVMARLAAAVQAAMADPEFIAGARQQMLPLRYLGPAEYTAELQALRTHYAALWARHPWKE